MASRNCADIFSATIRVEPRSRPPRLAISVRAAMVSRGGGNEAALEFEGTGLAIIGNLMRKGELADVIIDDKKVGDLNAFIIERTTDSDLWHIYGLEDRTHSLRIVTRDEADPRSEGKVVAIHRAVSFRAGG